MRRDDRTALLALLVLGGLLFGPTIPLAGLHLDDFAFHRLFARPWRDVWMMFLHYVPGRNLDIAYEAALRAALGSGPRALHCAGLLLDLANVALFYLLARRAGASPRWAFAAAGFFLVYPNHGETHFWTFAIAQNLAPVTLVLLSALCLRREKPLWLASFGLYLLALFDYDQAFLMWLPILLVGLLPVSRGTTRAAVKFAAACLAADLAHVSFRHLAAVSEGGRPVITLGRVLPSARAALEASLVPMMKLPRLEFLSAGEVILCAAAALTWGLLTRLLAREEIEAPAALRLIAAGVAWWACAYFPNLFWYLSPRHHYLPSAGLLLAAAGAASLAAARLSAYSKRALLVLGALAFGLAAGFDVAEGRAWAASSRLLETLAAELRAGPPADNVYVLGAPAGFGPAPALASPIEADFAASGDSGPLAHASIAPAATRRGLFSGCESDLFGDAGWSWRPLAGARILVYDGRGGFKRAGTLVIEPPGLPLVELALGSGPATARLAAPLWLAEARAARSAGGRLAGSGGVELSSASFRVVGPGVGELSLTWISARGDFAFILALDDARGRLFEARDRPKGRRETLWPAYDDLVEKRPGQSVVERWRLRLPRDPRGPVSATVTLFEPGRPWRPIGTLRFGML